MFIKLLHCNVISKTPFILTKGTIFIFLLVIYGVLFHFFATAQSKVQKQLNRPNVVLFKINRAYAGVCYPTRVDLATFNQNLASIGIKSVKKKHPHHGQGGLPKYAQSRLATVYEAQLQTGKNVRTVSKQLSNLRAVDWAEPAYINKTAFTPNDTSITEQFYLDIIKAQDAWNITQGDSTVWVGIIDSGVDMDHPDLASNIAINYADPIDGIDNDYDGYVDNYKGYDLAGADYNNPTPDPDPSIPAGNNAHGTHVGGIAAAHTNNTTGMAGVGFKCRLLPVKCAADNDNRANGVGYIIAGYEGVVFAAEAGAAVINCSWGSNNHSQYGQLAIDYATIDHNALVVAAAGNNNTDNAFYPASYPGVLNVAATETTDARASFSNYGYTVDIAAPGRAIYSTWYDDTYLAIRGTSMASPIVAGAAALLKSIKPNYSPAQLTAHLLNTADRIDTLGQNTGFENKLGSGRLNLFRAVTAPEKQGVDILDFKALNQNNSPYMRGGDTITIQGKLINVLAATTNLVLTLNPQPALPLLNHTLYLGVVQQGDTIDLAKLPAPLRLVLPNTLDFNYDFDLIVNITDTNYRTQKATSLRANRNYVDLKTEAYETTIAGFGRIGYVYDHATVGNGFYYNNDELLYEMGLMVGTSDGRLANTVRGGSGAYDQDFIDLMAIRDVSLLAEEAQIKARFNDSLAGPTMLPVEISQEVIAQHFGLESNYFIVKYNIINQGTATIDSLYAGLFADWDIGYPVSNNIANYDASRKLSYVYHINDDTYAGIMQLDSAPFNYYALNNADNGNPHIGTYDNFTDAEKRFALASGVQKTSAGMPNGADVSVVVGSGPVSIAPGDSAQVAFAVLAGTSIDSLQKTADRARLRYNPKVSAINNLKTTNNIVLYPNPATGSLFIDGAERFRWVKVFNANGQVIYSQKIANKPKLQINVANLAKGFYFVRFESTNNVATKYFIKK